MTAAAQITRLPSRLAGFDTQLRMLEQDAADNFASARDPATRTRWRLVLWKLRDAREILNRPMPADVLPGDVAASRAAGQRG